MSRALRLHERHTREELVAMLGEVHKRMDKAHGIHLLAPKDRKLHSDILWAIYWHDAPTGSRGQARGIEKRKNW